MGAFAYCSHCEAGVNPSLAEKLKGRTQCCCGEWRDWDKGVHEDAIDEIIERLEKLEKIVAELDNRTAGMIRLGG